MFTAMLATQWRWTRSVALLLALAGFAIPLASVRSASAHADPQLFLTTIESWGAVYALLSLGVGLLIALAAWGNDHQGRHVYALSLPIPRSRYVLLRFVAGCVLVAPAVAGVLAGALTASLGAIPPGLHVFPFALTLRFAFCALLGFALFFAVGAATTRTAAIVLGLMGGVVFAQYLLSLTGASFNLLEFLGNALFVSPGLLSVFSGRWMLVDV
jgi:hypothetical protein